MQGKSTSALEQELSGCADLREYLKVNAAALHTPELPALLQETINRSGLSRAEVARRSGLNTVYVYQIFSGQRRPSRESLLCLCFAMELRAAQTQKLLLHAGYGQLYVRNRRESVIYYALDNALTLESVNQQLDALGEPPLH